MCNFRISNFHVLHATKIFMYCAKVLSLKLFNTLYHICYDKGKNEDHMQKVRYQHHNSICESMISRPDD